MSEAQNLPLEPASNPPWIAVKLGTRFFRFLLSTPLNRLLPHDLILLTVTSRETGKTRTLPVGYHVVDGKMAVLTSGRWRHDLRGGAPVVVTLKGKKRRARADLEEGPDEVTRVYEKLLEHVGLDKAEKIDLVVKERRQPTFEELKAAVAGTAVVWLELAD